MKENTFEEPRRSQQRDSLLHTNLDMQRSLSICHHAMMMMMMPMRDSISNSAVTRIRNVVSESSGAMWSDETTIDIAYRNVEQEGCERQRFEKLFLLLQWHK